MPTEILIAVIGVLGVVIGVGVGRYTARESHRRAERADLDRRIEWAIEQAVSQNEIAAQVGVSQLEVLLTDPSAAPQHGRRVDAALSALIRPDLGEVSS